MPDTNIQLINYSDDQGQIIGKLNNNFDEVIELHGGTRGTIGPTGADGAIGERGPVGVTGFDGTRGTRWFVSGSSPAGSAQEGDYWIDSSTSDIYQLNSTGWEATGYNIKTSGALFSSVNSAYSTGSGRAIQINQVLPKNYLFVLADVAPESQVLNELLSKFTISTDSLVNDSPLLEFSRSDLETGNVSDYSLHPVFYWPSAYPEDNSLGFRVPGGRLGIGVTGGFASSFDSLNIDSQSSVYIDYGSTGSVFATGGYSLATPSEFNILSKNVSITGGSGSFFDPLTSEVTLDLATPHTTITAGGTTPAKKAQIVINFNNWVSDGLSATNEGISVTTPLGTLSFTVLSGTGYETYGDDFIINQVIPILETSGFNTNYNFSSSLASAEAAILLIEADLIGPLYSFLTNTPNNVQVVNVTPGTNDPPGFLSTRTGDTTAKLSSTVYHLNLESNSSDSELFLSTKGKLRTKKTTEGLSYSANNPSYQVQNGATSWFFISRTATPYTVSLPSSVLENGNTIIINPAVVANTFVGIGFYNGADYSWGGSGGLKPGESIDIRVYNSSDSSTTVSGFKYIGIGTGGTGGTAATKVTLPFHARSIDFTLSKGPTGTTVYWKTYAPWPSATVGGTGGSFIY